MIELLRYRDLGKVVRYRDLLEGAGIATFIRNEDVATAHGFAIPDYFPALCIVHDEDQAEAIQLIAKQRSAEEESSDVEVQCHRCGELSPSHFLACWKCGSDIAPQGVE